MSRTASKMGAGFISMPWPPPKGASSTVRCRSWVQSLRSYASNEKMPLACARPMIEASSEGRRRPGKQREGLDDHRSSPPSTKARGHADPNDAGIRNLQHDVIDNWDKNLAEWALDDPDIIGRPHHDLLDGPESQGSRIGNLAAKERLSVVGATSSGRSCSRASR